jgi:hypothetical protein
MDLGLNDKRVLGLGGSTKAGAITGQSIAADGVHLRNP